MGSKIVQHFCGPPLSCEQRRVKAPPSRTKRLWAKPPFDINQYSFWCAFTLYCSHSSTQWACRQCHTPPTTHPPILAGYGVRRRADWGRLAQYKGIMDHRFPTPLGLVLFSQHHSGHSVTLWKGPLDEFSSFPLLPTVLCIHCRIKCTH